MPRRICLEILHLVGKVRAAANTLNNTGSDYPVIVKPEKKSFSNNNCFVGPKRILDILYVQEVLYIFCS